MECMKNKYVAVQHLNTIVPVSLFRKSLPRKKNHNGVNNLIS